MHSPVFKAFQSKLQVCVWPSSIKAKGQTSSFLKFCNIYGFTYINLIYAYLGEIWTWPPASEPILESVPSDLMEISI